MTEVEGPAFRSLATQAISLNAVSLRKLASEDGLNVRQAVAQGFVFIGEAQPLGQADGVIKTILGIAIADARVSLRVRLVHIVVGLLAPSPALIELGQFGLPSFFFFGHLQILMQGCLGQVTLPVPGFSVLETCLINGRSGVLYQGTASSRAASGEARGRLQPLFSAFPAAIDRSISNVLVEGGSTGL